MSRRLSSTHTPVLVVDPDDVLQGEGVVLKVVTLLRPSLGAVTLVCPLQSVPHKVLSD